MKRLLQISLLINAPPSTLAPTPQVSDHVSPVKPTPVPPEDVTIVSEATLTQQAVLESCDILGCYSVFTVSEATSTFYTGYLHVQHLAKE